MQVVGIHSAGHDTGVCLWRDGRLVYSIETERLTRKRHDHAVGAALAALRELPRFEPDAVDVVAVSTEIRQAIVRLSDFRRAMDAVRNGKLHYETACDVFGSRKRCIVVAHEASHAAMALHYLGYDKPAAVLVNEGRGSFSRNSLFGYTGSRLILESIDPLPWYGSGLGWSGVGYLLGLGRGPSVAGKVMALGGFAEPSELMISAILDLARDLGGKTEGELVLEGRRLLEKIGFAGSFLEKARLVSSLQHLFTETVTSLLSSHIASAGLRRAALGGGCALNIVTNSHLRKALNAALAVAPACNDAGQALGAAIYAQKFVLDIDPQPFPVYSNGSPEPADTIRRTLSDRGIACSDYDADVVATRLAEGSVVAFSHGAAELGPRALGHRSLLASPVVKGMKQRVSDRIKGREWFRPLAPVVREETFSKSLPGEPLSPYMLFNYSAARLGMPEATHVDGTARIQTLSARMNPVLHALIGAFEARSGVSGLINTSLNAGGMPIAQTARDVLNDFWASDVDLFVLGDVMVERRR